jgi:formylglycine-generating enzyme required for sulfatase activity
LWYALGGIAVVFLLIILFMTAKKPVPAAVAEEIPIEALPEVIPEEEGFVYVAGGTFTMGCTSEQGNDCDSDEKPAHQVNLSSYYIGKYEVTQAQWKAVMGTNPSEFKGDNLPVDNVSWEDIQGFLRKLNAQTGKSYRLPTEAEWEYACRGGARSTHYKYSGSNTIGNVAWYHENSGDKTLKDSEWDFDKLTKNNCKTHPVGQKTPNELGIYDMSGNVWEWCSDWYGDYSSSSQTNPAGASSESHRVIRGGSWGGDAGSCRVSLRAGSAPDTRSNYLGFRLALSL